MNSLDFIDLYKSIDFQFYNFYFSKYSNVLSINDELWCYIYLKK